MSRQPLRVAAVSAIAVCASACAETPKPVPSMGAAPAKAAAVSPAPAPKPFAGADLETEIQRAQALRAQGNLTEAIRALAQLVLVAPDDSRVIGEYGKALVQQGRAEDAVAFLKRAVQLRPGDWTYFSALGVAYDQMDDSKNAAAAYDHGLVLHPGDPAILNNYAVSRMLAGDLNGAEKLLKEAQAAGYNPKLASNLALLAKMRAAKTTAATQPGNAATKPPQVLASAPAMSRAANAAPKTHSGNIAPKTQASVPAPVTTTSALASPPVRSMAAMQPVTKATAAAPAKFVNTPAQGLALAPANVRTNAGAKQQPEKLASGPANPRSAIPPAPIRTMVVKQPVPKDMPATSVKMPNRPPQAFASAPRDIKPALQPPMPSMVVMQTVPKDPEAGPVKKTAPAAPVKVASKSVTHTEVHPASASKSIKLAKEAAPAPAKSSVPALRTADQGD